MKVFFKPVLAAGLILAAASPLAIAPASAQVVRGIGVIDPATIVSGSNAFRTAEAQRPQTYSQYYEAARTRNQQIEQQLGPLIDRFEADRQQPNPNAEALQQQAATIQQINQQGQRELAQILAPVVQSQDYVDEQINDMLPQAIENAAKKKNITLILNRATGAVVYRDQAYSMNQDVIAELDALLPVAQLSPPPGWMPRELREEAARRAALESASQQEATGQQAPAPVAPVAAPAGPPAESR